jgi:hypothetical protein
VAPRPPDPSAVTPEPSAGYIRGGAGIAVDSRRVVQVAVLGCLAALAVLTITLGLGAWHEVSQNHRMQSHGVAVNVRVTGCVGTATGTGITVNGFVCRGSFVLNRGRYDETIRGSSTLWPVGSVVAGKVDPDSPGTLFTAAAVSNPPSSWQVFARALASGAVLVVLGMAAVWWQRRRRRVDSA